MSSETEKKYPIVLKAQVVVAKQLWDLSPKQSDHFDRLIAISFNFGSEHVIDKILEVQMNKEDRQHVHDIVDAAIDGQEIQHHFSNGWESLDKTPNLCGLIEGPATYRVTLEPEEMDWHEKYFDPIINQHVGVMGAMKYILDEKGSIVTEGYHGFWHHEGTLMGSLGARKTVVCYHEKALDPKKEGD